MTKAKIYHIDDDPTILKIVSRILQAGGYDVDSQHTMTMAPHWSGYNLLILDWLMPGHGGETLARTARDDGYKGPILILSSKTLDADERQTLSLVNAQYLPKPFGPRDLLTRVRDMLAERT